MKPCQEKGGLETAGFHNFIGVEFIDLIELAAENVSQKFILQSYGLCSTENETSILITLTLCTKSPGIFQIKI